MLAGTCLLTIKCNYRCPYCDQATDAVYHNLNDVEYTSWKRFFHQLPPSFLAFSGGEPLLYPGVFELLEGKPKRHLYYLTTNLSQPIKRLLDVADPKQLILLAASLHPSSPTFSLKAFLSQVRLVKEHHIPVYVNFVAYPQQMDLIPFLKKAVTTVGAIFNVDPFISTKYKYTEQEERKVQEYVKQKRKLNYALEETGQEKMCSAGQDYFFAVPSGAVYRCMGGFYTNREAFYLFNIKDTPSFLPHKTTCYAVCRAVCDQNMVTITNKSGEMLSKPNRHEKLVLQIGRSFMKSATVRKLWNTTPLYRLMELTRK